MKTPWPTVPLRQVIRPRKEFITINDLRSYKRPRVQLHARGIVLRDQVPGALIKTKRQQICRTGDFLVAEIDAKVGGFGMVPDLLDGSIVSSHYFLFVVDETQVVPRFLDYFIRTPAFRGQVEAQGSTNYAAIRPDDVLTYKIPFPSLAEQQQMVERIDLLGGLINEARHLRKEADEETGALMRSITKSDPHAKLTPMHELVKLRVPDVTVRAQDTYQFAGVYCFGRGVFRGQQKSGMEFAYSRLTTLKAGDFTYPKLMAWEGALGIVPPECDGCVVSTEFPVFEVNTDRVFPDVLDVHFRDPSTWPKLSGASTGTNVRRRRLNPADFLSYQIPLPSREVQTQLSQIRADLATIKTTRDEASNELDSFLPSVLSLAYDGGLNVV